MFHFRMWSKKFHPKLFASYQQASPQLPIFDLPRRTDFQKCFQKLVQLKQSLRMFCLLGLQVLLLQQIKAGSHTHGPDVAIHFLIQFVLVDIWESIPFDRIFVASPCSSFHCLHEHHCPYTRPSLYTRLGAYTYSGCFRQLF